MTTDYRFMVSPKELHSLGLCGSDALLFSALVALCHRKGKWLLNYTFLADFACVGGLTTAWRIMKRLICKGLVSVENVEGEKYVVIRQQPLQNAKESLQNAKEPLQNAKELLQNAKTAPYYNTNNIYNNPSGGVTHAHTRDTTTGTTTPFFQNWWDIYTGGKKMWQGVRIQTHREWNKLTPEEQKQVLRHTQAFAGKNLRKQSPKQPNWYLLDRTWDEPLANIEPPAFLSGAEQDECRRQNIPLVQVRTHDGLFKIMRKTDALNTQTTIIRDW